MSKDESYTTTSCRHHHIFKATMSSRFCALKAEIDAKRRLIATLPGWIAVTTRDQGNEKASHIKQLAEKEGECALLVDANRIDSVVREHENLHPPITEECPICLDEVNLPFGSSMAWFACCGNGMCRDCHERSGGRMEKCPLCRADFPESDDEKVALVKKAAEIGHSWAQSEMGNSFYNGTGGFPLDKREAFRWYKLAAEQNHLGAMARLALFYREGEVVEQSVSKAVDLMTKAADMGWIPAQEYLGGWYLSGDTVLPKNLSKSLHYFTLANRQQEDDRVQYNLGMFHETGEGGLPKSLILAKHYFGKAAKNGFEEAYYPYARVMFGLWESQYCDSAGLSLDLPGHSVLPKCLYWLRKADASGDSDAISEIREMEEYGQSKCGNCREPAVESIDTLKQCARCKGAWYCSRDCQVQAWKAGHKTDCINY